MDGQSVPNWVHRTIEQLLRAKSVRVSLIIVNGTSSTSSRPKPLLFKAWKMVDRCLFRRVLPQEAHSWLADVGESEDPLATKTRSYQVPTMSLSPGSAIAGCTLSNSDVEQIRSHNLDVLVQLGSEDLPVEILNCAKYGVWAFHYRGYRGVANDIALFWRMFGGHRICELVLVASLGGHRQDQVIYHGVVSGDLFSLHRNLALDCCRRSRILLRRLSDLASNGWSNLVVEDVVEGCLVDQQTDGRSLSPEIPRFILSWFMRVLRRLAVRLCFQERWLLAYCKAASAPDIEKIELDRLSIVVPPRDQNYCDPFPFEFNGRTYLFFERYAGLEPGTICCAELNDDGTFGEICQVLAKNYHLSYPSVFEWHGKIYMLPETGDNKNVELYVAIDFPYRWEFAAVLLKDTIAADATIVEHDGKLWLFAAGIGGPGTESSELSLFFADSLLGEWHSHPKNPIVCDVRRARPAGNLFLHRNVLIRPGQDCSNSYGYAISFNKVVVLSEIDYKEVPITSILPNWMPRLCGTHTFNQRDGVRVLDGRMSVPRWFPVGRIFPPQLEHDVVVPSIVKA